MNPECGSRRLHSLRILRQGDDAIAQRLGPASRQRQAHASSVDPRLRHGLRFLDFVPDGWFQRRKKRHRLPHVFLRQSLGDRVHPRGTPGRPVGHGIFSSAALEVGHLPHHVLDRQTREHGGFRMAMSRHQMAGSAGLHLEPVLHDVRQLGMLFGIPIRRVERIVDLRLREGFGAARKALQFLRVAGGRRILVRHRIRPRETLLRLLRQRHHYTERQQCDENQGQMLHEGLLDDLELYHFAPGPLGGYTESHESVLARDAPGRFGACADSIRSSTRIRDGGATDTCASVPRLSRNCRKRYLPIFNGADA